MKCAVIGDGIAGLSVAYHLCKAGMFVHIYSHPDKYPRASDAAQGVICNKGLLVPNKSLFHAKLESLNWVKDQIFALERETGRSIEHKFDEVIEPFSDSRTFRNSVERIYKGDFWGCFKAETFKGPYSPWSGISYGHIRYSDEGWFNTRSLMDALRSFLEQNQVNFVNQEVLKVDANGLLKLASDRKSSIYDHIVLANGWGMVDLTLRSELKLPRMRPASGHTIKLTMQDDFGEYNLVSGTKSLIVRGREAYLGSSTIKKSSVTEDEGSADVQALLNVGAEIFGCKSLIDNSSSQALWGTRAFTKDRSPFYGQLEQRGHSQVWCLGGFFKSGLQFSNFLAEALTRTMKGQKIHPLAQQFSIDRLL